MSQKISNFYFEIVPKRQFSLGLRELWLYRELCFFFIWRDVKVKYKQATLGILWVLIQPLAMMFVFTLVFSRGLNMPSDGIAYPIFVLSGLLIWNIFSNGLQNSANSIVTNSNIIKKIYFPRLIIPVAAVGTALIDFFVTLFLFLLIIIFGNTPFDFLKFLCYFPIALLLTLFTTLGLGTWLAAWNVKYRDFQYVLPFAIQFLLFVNPVIYSPNILGNSWLKSLFLLNPIATAIRLLRASFNKEYLPAHEIFIAFGISFLFCLIGIIVFRRMETYFADLA